MDTSSGDASVFVDVVEAEAEAGASGLGASEPAAEGETPAGSPWWKAWCERIGAGETGLDATRTTLALQLQAQDHAERLAREAREAGAAQFAAQEAGYARQLALRDQQIADLQREFKALKDQEEDKEPEHREFSPRSLDNPFGVVVGSERAGKKAEPCLRHYGSEKAFAYLEELCFPRQVWLWLAPRRLVYCPMCLNRSGPPRAAQPSY